MSRIYPKPSLPIAPWDANLEEMAYRVIGKSLRRDELQHMGAALLQLLDEVAELRERVRKLESETPPG